MLAAAKVLSKVQGQGVTLVPAGDRLRFHPASALTPEMIEELRQHKQSILLMLRRREERQQDTSPRIGSTGEVLQLAREILPERKEEDRVDLDELIQANSPPSPGRATRSRPGTDKALFFSRDRWREAEPRDFKVYRGGAA